MHPCWFCATTLALLALMHIASLTEGPVEIKTPDHPVAGFAKMP